MENELDGFEKVCKVSKLIGNEGQHFKVNDIDIAGLFFNLTSRNS